MHHVKLRADVVDVARMTADRWYVTNGATAIGPVNLDLLARGVEAGKVSPDCYVRHEAWKVWRPLTDLAEITDDEGHLEPNRPSLEDLGNRPSLPDNFIPSEAVTGAVDGYDALLQLLQSAVARSRAEAALIHHVADEGAVAVCAHGPELFEALGLRTRLLDPAMVAAASGAIVVAEPAPGPAGKAILERLGRLGVPVDAALMLPIRPHGRLYGTIELGRRTAFRPAEIAGVEALIDDLVQKLEVLG